MSKSALARLETGSHPAWAALQGVVLRVGEPATGHPPAGNRLRGGGQATLTGRLEPRRLERQTRTDPVRALLHRPWRHRRVDQLHVRALLEAVTGVDRESHADLLAFTHGTTVRARTTLREQRHHELLH